MPLTGPKGIPTMEYHACTNCGERIAADSVLPDECPNCGHDDWDTVTA